MDSFVDISEILRRKAERRRRLARLTFEQKIEIVRRLQELSRSIKEASPSRKPRDGKLAR